MNEQECQAKGGKLVDGKCEMPNVIPSTSGFKSKKKSNNPFRMWQSYFGGLITVILPQIITLNIIPKSLSFLINPITNIVVSFILGFLAGWLITVLWRKYKT